MIASSEPSAMSESADVVGQRGTGGGVDDGVLNRGSKARWRDEEAGARGGRVALGEAADVEGALRCQHGVAGCRVGGHVAVGVVFNDEEVELARDLHDGLAALEAGDAAERVVDRRHGVDGCGAVALADGAERGGSHTLSVEVERDPACSRASGPARGCRCR
jgi:hypothetical protein